MRIGFLTRWDRADYSKSLFNALCNHDNNNCKFELIRWDFASDKFSTIKLLLAPILHLNLIFNKTRRCDIIHVQYIFGNFLLLFLPVLWIFSIINHSKIILTLHEHYSYQYLTKFEKIFARLHRKFACYLSNSIIVHTKTEMEYLPTEKCKNKCKVIPHGIKQSEKDQHQTHSKIINNDVKSILIPGRISPDKDHKTAIKAMQYIRNENNVKMYIIGEPSDNSYLDELNELIYQSSLNSRVEIVDRYLSEEEYHLIFQDADLCLLAYPEKCSSSGVLEDVINFSKPVVISDSPALVEYTKDLAVYYQVGNSANAAKKISQVLNNKNIATQISNDIENLRDAYRWEKVATQHIELYYRTRNKSHTGTVSPSDN